MRTRGLLSRTERCCGSISPTLSVTSTSGGGSSTGSAGGSMPRRFGRICRAGEPKKSRSSSAAGGPAAVSGCAVFRRKPETEERPGGGVRFSARRPGCIRRRRVGGRNRSRRGARRARCRFGRSPIRRRIVCFKEFPPATNRRGRGKFRFRGECGRATECGGCRNIRTMYGHNLLTFRCVGVFSMAGA